MMHGAPGGPGRMHGGQMFASMSEAGRKTMMDAMGPRENRKAEHEQVRAARDRMLAVLDADRLDTAALKRAIDDEQATVNASRERRQAAMLSGFSKLSTADRKAFVADARAMKTRMEARMQKWRGKGGMNDMGDMGDMPTPPM